MRLLLVGFQPYEEIAYPHLQQVAQHLCPHRENYALFRERGYFLDTCFQPTRSPRQWLQSVYTLATIIIDTARLATRRILGNYDVVVAVDNFAFIAASLFFRHVVLWSHDFVTDDQQRSHSWVHKLIRKGVMAGLGKSPDIIIQDRARLEIFCARYLGDGDMNQVNPFLLPVSLTPISGRPIPPRHRAAERPVVLQIGGINAWRSMSERILDHYQTHHECYELAFHGFIDKDMARRISNAAYIPWTSSINMEAGSVYKIVEKCDIGFLAYNAEDLNFHHIARASGQLVEFLRCGKPVIVMGNTALRELVEDREIGVAIASTDELDAAIKRVSASHKCYSENCKKLYESEYDLDNYLASLTAWLHRTVRP